MAHIFFFTPKGGAFGFEKMDQVKEAIHGLRPVRHIMTIKEYREKRSLGVNAYYWAVVVPHFADEWAGPVEGRHDQTTLQEIHDILGDRFRRFESELVPGQTYIKGTSTMTGRKFWRYLDQCYELYANYFQGDIPLPHAVGYLPREITENDKKVKA